MLIAWNQFVANLAARRGCTHREGSALRLIAPLPLVRMGGVSLFAGDVANHVCLADLNPHSLVGCCLLADAESGDPVRDGLFCSTRTGSPLSSWSITITLLAVCLLLLAPERNELSVCCIVLPTTPVG